MHLSSKSSRRNIRDLGLLSRHMRNEAKEWTCEKRSRDVSIPTKIKSSFGEVSARFSRIFGLCSLLFVAIACVSSGQMDRCRQRAKCSSDVARQRERGKKWNTRSHRHLAGLKSGRCLCFYLGLTNTRANLFLQCVVNWHTVCNLCLL